MTVFLNDWSEPRYNGSLGIDALKDDFEIKDNSLDGANILYASYTQEDYAGNALVVFERDGNLFLVSGGHCSCYGLEGQWEPEETTVEALENLLDVGGSYYTLGGSDYGGMEKNREAMRRAIDSFQSSQAK